MFDKYAYYQASVQDPAEHTFLFSEMYRRANGKEAVSLREDFSGTFLISTDWIKSNQERTAVAVDFDVEPIQYGLKHQYKKMSSSEKKRFDYKIADVCHVKTAQVDVVAACNFSFNVFKTRDHLRKYFKNVHKGLKKGGILVLEMAGGPGLIEPGKENRKVKDSKLGKFTYTWHQKSFDPINADVQFAIHFKTEKGKVYKNVFEYDWRLWSIPEVREVMTEAGFSKVTVYWEGTDKDGEGTDEYLPMTSGDNAYSWIAFVVGQK